MGTPVLIKKAHNIYGAQMAATYEGVKKFIYPTICHHKIRFIQERSKLYLQLV
jgi:hypothetical protein